MNRQETQYCMMRIRSHYPQFRGKEQVIADYILNNPQKIVHSTINQVADDLGVADSTVFRFCQRIGFKGYQAMKIALATEIVEPIQDIHENILENDSEKTIAEKVFRSNIRTLEDTLKILDDQAFHEVISAILGARKVELFGSGGSNVIAMDAYHKLIRTGISVNVQSDTHMQLMSASQLTNEDVAIIISHTGASKDMMHILEVVKANGVKTIGITNFAKSPLSQGVDIALYTMSEETDYRSEALSSRIAQLAMIDAIYVNVLMAMKDTGKEALQKVRAAISVKRI